jgi:hypothetical protein
MSIMDMREKLLEISEHVDWLFVILSRVAAGGFGGLMIGALLGMFGPAWEMAGLIVPGGVVGVVIGLVVSVQEVRQKPRIRP